MFAAEDLLTELPPILKNSRLTMAFPSPKIFL